MTMTRTIHHVTVRWVKTRNRWEGRCTADDFSIDAPKDQERCVRSNAARHAEMHR